MAGFFIPLLASAASPTNGMVVRVRLADGTMERVQVKPGLEETMTLKELLDPFKVDEESVSVQFGTSGDSVDIKSTLLDLGAKHGSMITVKSKSANKPTESRLSQLKVKKRTWDPFPDLAKDYEQALLKTKTKRSSQKAMSYGAISSLQSSLHIMEPQQEGPLKRVYMCAKSAERFHANGLKKDGGVQCRVGLLLGTIQKERVDLSPRKARTSLSSQTSGSDYCTVAKVQAVWEPAGQKPNKVYDESIAVEMLNENQRALKIAEKLGLTPVGWIFSHQDNRHENEDALPVYGLDIQTGSTLQIAKMRSQGNTEGTKFVTLAMDANTGATEAFQLSDVCVQMVHEGNLLTEKGKSERFVATKHAVMVDGKETNDLDSVLCLVNTAMLSHFGSFSGNTAIISVKKNGRLTNKAKKVLLKALDSDSQLLEELCNFNTIMALDQSLSSEDSEKLCELVWKWARGQKQGTKLGSKLKMHLRSILET
eukprot:scaffold4009_cov124-Cylindrotheca_fusiformis.AAC.15